MATGGLQQHKGVLSLWDVPSLVGKGDQNPREVKLGTWEAEATAQAKCRNTEKQDHQSVSGSRLSMECPTHEKKRSQP